MGERRPRPPVRPSPPRPGQIERNDGGYAPKRDPSPPGNPPSEGTGKGGGGTDNE